MKKLIVVLAAVAAFGAAVGTALPASAHSEDAAPLWMKVRAKNKFDRTRIANTGVSIEMTREDYVMVLGSEAQKQKLQKLGLLQSSFDATIDMMDFPSSDSNFHNYTEMKTALEALVTQYPALASLDSIGKSVEGREILRLRITNDLSTASQKAAVLIMGGHHAREHVSIEIPYMFAEHLLKSYVAGDAEVRRLVDNRDIQIVPMVNPDGAEYDISSSRYKMWRKNRAKNHDGTYGVDLNRNYGQLWGQGGSSDDPSDETYMGPSAFSEPETQAVKRWVESTPNTTVLLSMHTYSELILYPWGGVYDKVSNQRDYNVFTTMAKTMATWNGYQPQQSSELYIATGDTCDWAYEAHKIFAFTFELDPSNMWDGGFYPGQAILPGVFKKNLKPMMYMLDVADNPYKTIEPTSAAFGLSSGLIQ